MKNAFCFGFGQTFWLCFLWKRKENLNREGSDYELHSLGQREGKDTDKEVVQKLPSCNSVLGQLKSPGVFILLKTNLSGTALHLP